MSFEVPPLIADWLADATYGVNAITASVPRDAGDALPPTVRIADEVRDAWCARRQIAKEHLDDGPVVAVFQSGEADYPFGRAQRSLQGGMLLEGQATYLLLYIQRESDSALAASHARYTLRGALNSLILMMDPKSGATLSRNGVEVVTAKKYQTSTLLEERGDALVTGGVLAVLEIRELVQFIIP